MKVAVLLYLTFQPNFGYLLLGGMQIFVYRNPMVQLETYLCLAPQNQTTV